VRALKPLSKKTTNAATQGRASSLAIFTRSTICAPAYNHDWPLRLLDPLGNRLELQPRHILSVDGHDQIAAPRVRVSGNVNRAQTNKLSIADEHQSNAPDVDPAKPFCDPGQISSAVERVHVCACASLIHPQTHQSPMPTFSTDAAVTRKQRRHEDSIRPRSEYEAYLNRFPEGIDARPAPHNTAQPPQTLLAHLTRCEAHLCCPWAAAGAGRWIRARRPPRTRGSAASTATSPSASLRANQRAVHRVAAPPNSGR
jgi:hypothetical protein